MSQTEVLDNLRSLERHNFKSKLHQRTQSWIVQDEGVWLQWKQVYDIMIHSSEGLYAAPCCVKRTGSAHSRKHLTLGLLIYTRYLLFLFLIIFTEAEVLLKNQNVDLFFLGSRWRVVSLLIALKMLLKCSWGLLQIFKSTAPWLIICGLHPSPMFWMCRSWYLEKATWGLQKAMDVTCLELAIRKHEGKGHTCVNLHS